MRFINIKGIHKILLTYNGTEFIGRAVSFHRKKGESNENNNLINEEDKNKISYVEDNKTRKAVFR